MAWERFGRLLDASGQTSQSGAVEVDARVAISRTRKDPWKAAEWLQ
jgi:hypothetical protein